MKVSTNLLRSYARQYHWSDPMPGGVDELVEKIGAQLGGVEEVVSLGKRFEGIPIVKIISCVDHPDSDHLHICKVDDGQVIADVPRDDQGLVQIVTGAPNVHDGFVAAWLPPGSTVPESVDKEPFVLEARALRGETSYGMLASARELTLGDDHNGILEFDAGIAPGSWLVDVANLRDEYIIDIENKMFTHRPDCFGLLGVAREIAGIYHQPFKSPEWYRTDASLPTVETELPLAVRNDLPELVPRFTALPMANVTIKPSPLWLKTFLVRLGVRPINNVVDLTNYYMLLTSQPLHVYDYDKVKAQDSGANQATLVVRHPEPNEKLELLSGKTVEPKGEAILIATEQKAIGLGGVMGGGDTEVDDNTKNIIIECATFDMYTIRRMSMAYGVFTDAVTRFNKGQSPLQNLAVLAQIAEDMSKEAGAHIAGPVVDDNHLDHEVMERGNIYPPVSVSQDFIADRLGIDLSAEEMAQLLRNVECVVDVQGEDLVVHAPFWRTDIAIPEDIVEEVGRLYGYDHLPLNLPKRDLTPATRSRTYDLKAAIGEWLSSNGANEVLTYTFVHGRLLQHVGQNSELAFQLSNALSPDLQYYRLSLMPSLLDKVHANNRAGYESFALFELNKVHLKTELDEDGLPIEFERLALVFAASGKTAKEYSGAAYFEAKAYLSGLLKHFGILESVSFQPLKEANFSGHQATEEMCKPFDASRAAAVTLNNKIIGVVGEYRQSVKQSLKLPNFCAGFELFTASLQTTVSSYAPLPRFPKVEQDICLRLSSGTPYQVIYDFVLAQVTANQPENVYTTLEPMDIYQREDDEDQKQVTLRVGIASYERTLTDKAVNSLLDTVAQAAKAALGAERI